MITIGLGTLTAPELLAGLSLPEYREAFKDVGNYRHLQGDELDKAISSDYEKITGKSLKKQSKSTKLEEV